VIVYLTAFGAVGVPPSEGGDAVVVRPCPFPCKKHTKKEPLPTEVEILYYTLQKKSIVF
jgi:hypothetical protein